jgi:hypothetical protein
MNAAANALSRDPHGRDFYNVATNVRKLQNNLVDTVHIPAFDDET